MAILQALFALISKSAGKILNAIFGWAVHALFGQTSSGQQTFLSGLVGAAVAWPLLLTGLIAPKIAAFLLAFVPIPHWIPSWSVRLVWLGLVIIVPFALGIAITAKAPASAPPEPWWKRLARGFPITVGLATAFLVMFVSVPVMRLVALVRREKSADVPLITEADGYHRVAALVVEMLNRRGFELRPAAPGWWVSAPAQILGWFGGAAFRRFVPEHLEHYQSARLAVSFYSSGVLLRGKPASVAWAHGLIAEAVAESDGLQTVDSKAQKLETEIKRVWKAYAARPPQAEREAPPQEALDRVGEIAEELGKLDLEFDEWQVIYRQLLQLDRTLHGQRQLLEISQANQSTPSQSKPSQQEDRQRRTEGKAPAPESRKLPAPSPRV